MVTINGKTTVFMVLGLKGCKSEAVQQQVEEGNKALLRGTLDGVFVGVFCTKETLGDAIGAVLALKLGALWVMESLAASAMDQVNVSTDVARIQGKTNLITASTEGLQGDYVRWSDFLSCLAKGAWQ